MQIPIVRAPVELTVPTRKAVKDSLFATAVTAGDNVILDCSEIEVIDSAGIGALLDVAVRLSEEGGYLLLDRVPEPVFDLLVAFAGLDQVIFMRRAEAPLGDNR